MANTFRDLFIWQKGYKPVLEIYKITSKYPKEEKYGLVDQTRRSANGVIASIAEAHGRYHYADKARTLYISRGECHETQSHLSVARGVTYISEELFQDLDIRYQDLSRGISSYILSLKNAKR